jgi:hypothetical protein
VAPVLAGAGGSLQVAGGTGGLTPALYNGDSGYVRGSVGGSGAPGRIRLEGDSISLAAATTVPASQGPLSTVALAGTPNLRIVSVAGLAAPASPQASYTVPDVGLPPGFQNPVAVTVQATQIPPGTVVTVTSIPLQAAGTSASGVLTGSLAASSASVTLNLPADQPTLLAATAAFAVAAASDGPLYADSATPKGAQGPVPSRVEESAPSSVEEGDEVAHVKVAAVVGGPSSVTYLTKSGREIAVR